MGLGISQAADTDSAGTADIIDAGLDAGRQIGSLAFSKDMEIEADHLGIFILDEAGYDMRKGIGLHVRLNRIQIARQRRGQAGLLGFLETHPHPDERIQKLLATKSMIDRGAVRPAWKP